MAARPRITLKLATSLDGKIALGNGLSEWITGEESRLAGRRLRAAHDAIAVGANTAVLDNPQLTTRISGQPDPIRVIFDTHLRLLPQSNLAQTAKDVPVWIFCANEAEGYGPDLAQAGCRLFEIPRGETLDLVTAMDVLARSGVKTLLVEGGGTLAASFLRKNYIDVIEWFRAPIILGGDGRDGVGDLGLTVMPEKSNFNRISIAEIGNDIHERYERAA